MSRRFLFAAITLIGVVVVVESLSWLALVGVGGPGGGFSDLRESRRQLLEMHREEPGGRRKKGPRTAADVSLHPYMGYSLDPADPRVHDFGFRGSPDFVLHDPGTVVVAITGGSVSQSIWKRGGGEIRAALETIPEYEGKEIKLIAMGVWGWKQPQQLAAFSYLLALGGQFDILINIDGLNEIGSGKKLKAYLRGAIHPAYPSPRVWETMSKGMGSRSALVAAGEVQLLRQRRVDFARRLDRLRMSVTGNLVWSLGDRILQARIVDAEEKLLRVQEEEAGESLPNLYGPDEPRNLRQMQQYVADLWMRSTLQMEYLARGNHISYYHFIQPSQYMPGSKVLTPLERRKAFSKGGMYRDYVISGYPMLISRIPALALKGVRVFDLTGLFEDEKQSIYIDYCCHMNPRGDAMVGAAIGEAIVRDFEKTPCWDPQDSAPPAQSTRRCRR